MPQPVSNTTTIVSGSLLANKISYVVDGQGRDYRGGYNGLAWMSEAPAEGNVIFIGNSTTIGRGPADSPLFYPSFNNTEANIIYAVNKLPGSPGNLGTLSAAYDWAATNNFFINNSDNPIPRIDADGLALYVDAEQPTSYPQTGTSWYDLGGAGNTGTLTNGPVWNSNGWFTFDGVDDYVNVHNSTALVPTSTTSWEFILNPTSTSGYRAVFQKSNYGNSTGFISLFMNPGSLAFRLNASDVASSTRGLDHYFNGNITQNAYSHIILTYNGSAFNLYINGVATNPGSWTYGLGNNQGDFLIGTFWAGNWNGQMGVSRVYQKTLSSTEVKQNYYQAPIVTDGLVFAVDANNIVSYPKSGTSAYNLTGSGTGTLTNGPTFSQDNGGYWEFDGTDDYINFGNIANLGTSDFTLSVWVYIPSGTASTYRAILNKKGPNGADAGYGIYYNTGQQKFLWSTANGTTASEKFTTNTFEDIENTWAHVVMVRQSGATNNGHYYVNGVYQSLASAGAILNVDSSTNLSLAVAGNTYTPYCFQGNIANAQIYDRALTPDEVSQNYEATKYKFQGQEIVTNGLVMYLDSADKDSYPGTGTSWDDLTGNENNGTLVNGPSFLSNQNGGVFLFDGVDDYISRAYNSTFNITTGLTLSVTVKRNSIFSQLQDCFFLSRVPSWYFYDEYNSGNIRGEVFIDGVRRGAVQTSLPNDGKYYNIVYTYNSSTGLSAMYKNGSLATSVQLTGLSNYLIDSSTSNFSNLFFSSLGKSYFVGDIKIYNRALSADEVSQNFNAQRTRFGI